MANIASAHLGKRLSGKGIAKELASYVDSVIVTKLSDIKMTNLAILATGGYGREALAPYSDIDIAIVAKSRDKNTLRQSEEILYALWDTGLNISHSFRTLAEVLEDAFGDVTVRTCYFDIRFLCGDVELFKAFRSDVYQRLLYKNRRAFYGQLLQEIRKRHKVYGDSVYMLEPHIKDGCGGLRDIQSILWLSRSFYRAGNFEDLPDFLDKLSLTKAYQFLLKIRCILHLTTNSKTERLVFDYQQDVARVYGYKDTASFASAEIMMKNYYKHSTFISDALSGILYHCAKSLLSSTKHFFFKIVSQNFYILANELYFAKNTDITPHAVFEAFFILSRTAGLRLSHSAKLICSSVGRSYKGKLTPNSKMLFYFEQILKGLRVYETLLQMHYTYCLDLLIPEFARLRALVIYEPNHIYTVDEHTLFAIKHAEEFCLKTNLLTADQRYILFFALLLHDIGKGVSGKRYTRHEDDGYLMVKPIAERLGLSLNTQRHIEFLVKHHLYFAKLTLNRDPDDTKTIYASAELVLSTDRLKLLYALTYADMSAVNPQYFTEWKKASLMRLYQKTLSYLINQDEAETLNSKLKDFVQRFSLNYRLAGDAKRFERDYLLVGAFDGATPVIGIYKTNTGVEITIVSNDKPGVLLRILSVFVKKGLDICLARLYLSNDGAISLDRFEVSNWQQVYWEGLEQELKEELKTAILSDRVLRHKSRLTNQANALRFEPFLQVDNEFSEDFSIVEFVCLDRLGLLFDVAEVFCSYGINIHSAIVNTDRGIASDTFYISKLTSRHLLKVALQIHQVLGR